uniref:Uncharacterized protein n=1 Tax=Anguilla anguilla TaxID=7936 RepID=A0A0E9W6T9_ANGAN
MKILIPLNPLLSFFVITIPSHFMLPLPIYDTKHHSAWVNINWVHHSCIVTKGI